MRDITNYIFARSEGSEKKIQNLNNWARRDKPKPRK